jgi:nicotinate phosphoribosyltransferase
MTGDVVTLESDEQAGEPLLVPVMRGGCRTAIAPALQDIRYHASENLTRLPGPLRRLQEPFDYRVEIAAALHELAAQVDHRAMLCQSE